MITESRKRISPQQGITFWTIRYLAYGSVENNRIVVRESARRAFRIFRTALTHAPSLSIALPMGGDGTLYRFADDELFTQPSAEIEWANFGRAEFNRAQGCLKNPVTIAALGLRMARREPRLLMHPREALKNLIASGVSLGREGLGPYSEPHYVAERRGYIAGCLDECMTIVTLYHIQIKDFYGLMEFTRSPGHQEGVRSLESVSSKDPMLTSLSGTFGHLTTNWQDRSYPAMAESMQTVKRNAGQSTHRAFRLRDFPMLFEVKGESKEAIE